MKMNLRNLQSIAKQLEKKKAKGEKIRTDVNIDGEEVSLELLEVVITLIHQIEKMLD